MSMTDILKAFTRVSLCPPVRQSFWNRRKLNREAEHFTERLANEIDSRNISHDDKEILLFLAEKFFSAQKTPLDESFQEAPKNDVSLFVDVRDNLMADATIQGIEALMQETGHAVSLNAKTHGTETALTFAPGLTQDQIRVKLASASPLRVVHTAPEN